MKNWWDAVIPSREDSLTEKGNLGGDPLSAKPMGLGSEKAGLPVWNARRNQCEFQTTN